MAISRRDFMKKGLAAGAGLAAASIPSFAKEEKPLIAPVREAPSQAAPSGPDPVLERIRQAKFVKRKKGQAHVLGLLHYSDIHGDDVAVEKIKDAIGKYEPYIDGVLNTGDAVEYYIEPSEKYPYGTSWWQGTGLAQKSLFVLGNHDGAMPDTSRGFREGSADWDFRGKQWVFDAYFGPYAKGLGYTLPKGWDNPASPYYKSCFWHKDFPKHKVRVIGVDNIHFNDNFHYLSSEQEEWFKARLADTLDESNPAYGYSVVVASHYPLDDFSGQSEQWDEKTHRFRYNFGREGGAVMDFKTGAVTNFHSWDRTGFEADKRFSLRRKKVIPTEQYGYALSDENPFGDALEAWRLKGGKFVAWICGHCHYDLMYYPTKYPDLLCIELDQAGNLRGNYFASREQDGQGRACANFYAIDPLSGLLKIVRIGLQMDRFLVSKSTLCYDYVNRVVVSQS